LFSGLIFAAKKIKGEHREASNYDPVSQVLLVSVGLQVLSNAGQRWSGIVAVEFHVRKTWDREERWRPSFYEGYDGPP